LSTSLFFFLAQEGQEIRGGSRLSFLLTSLVKESWERFRIEDHVTYLGLGSMSRGSIKVSSMVIKEKKPEKKSSTVEN